MWESQFYHNVSLLFRRTYQLVKFSSHLFLLAIYIAREREREREYDTMAIWMWRLDWIINMTKEFVVWHFCASSPNIIDKHTTFQKFDFFFSLLLFSVLFCSFFVLLLLPLFDIEVIGRVKICRLVVLWLASKVKLNNKLIDQKTRIEGYFVLWRLCVCDPFLLQMKYLVNPGLITVCTF